MRQQCSNCYNDCDDACICFNCMEQVVYALRNIKTEAKSTIFDAENRLANILGLTKEGLKGIDIA